MGARARRAAPQGRSALSAMRYLLDTDTVSRLARGDSPRLTERFGFGEVGSFAISVVTLGELRFGQAAGVVAKTVAARTEILLRSIPTLPLGESAVPHYATVRSTLRRLGTPIGPNDTWIAAHALAEGLILVTGNDREFARVPGLKVENWLR